jgi:trans-2,3-dihydro-3-hydroxyanthranilate isomerase
LKRPLTWLDVFTGTPLTGNQLAVVHDADGLDDATMVAFARETRLSETTFVQSPAAAGADYRNRIFMTTGELPFAGHPSLGTAVAVARARGERQAHYVQQTPAGLQPVEVEVDGDRAHASMLQEPAEFGAEVDPAEALAAAGLAADDDEPGLPPQVVSTGVAQLLLPVRHSALARVRPDPAAVERLLAGCAAITLYVAAWQRGTDRVRARSFFTEFGGVTEDPATGSAAGPLMAYLHARAGVTSVDIRQGEEMARPSLLRCRIDMDAGRVRVGGEAVVIAEGTVDL